MKKALSLLLALLMLTSLLVVPVAADADDGFNDGQFGDWGDGTDDPVDPPVDPDEPIAGTQDNPIYVAMGKSAPTSLQLKAGESIYYQLKAAVFNGYSIIVSDTNVAIIVDGVRYDYDNAASMIDRGIKVTLEFNPMSPAIICFINEGEEDMVDPVDVTWGMPVGTESDPLPLADGANTVVIPENVFPYYASYIPTAEGDYVFAASSYEDFAIYMDTDSDPATTEDQVLMTEDVTYSVDNEAKSQPIFFIIAQQGTNPEFSMTITPPAKGTETNPYYMFMYDEVMNGVSELGDALWPASAEGVHYCYGISNTTLVVKGTGSVSVNGTSHKLNGTYKVVVGEDLVNLVFTASENSFFELSVLYPEGTDMNPQVLNKYSNAITLPEGGATYYFVYTADKTGTLAITFNTLNGVGYTEAVNQTTGDSDYVYAGTEIDGEIFGASEDDVLNVPVTKGDKVVIYSNSIKENDDFEIVALSLKLFVGYKGEKYATITKEPATAAYAKEGAKVSVKITASGDGLKYTWYIKNDGSSKYSKSSITSSTYSATMSDKVKGRKIYCVVTDKYGSKVQSKTFLLRESVSITKEPATTAYAKKGAKASVKISASGDGLKYTWYIKNDGKKTYSKSSITSSTYSATMSSSVKGRRVYCVVTDKYGNKVQSKTFLLREAVSITTQPKTVTVKKNATAKVTVKASGDGLKYTWYIKNSGAKKYTKSSVKTSTYSVKMTSKVKNRQVYCVVTDKYGKTVKSTTVKLKMK